jgi:hypothetical protein
MSEINHRSIEGLTYNYTCKVRSSMLYMYLVILCRVSKQDLQTLIHFVMSDNPHLNRIIAEASLSIAIAASPANNCCSILNLNQIIVAASQL